MLSKPMSSSMSALLLGLLFAGKALTTYPFPAPSMGYWNDLDEVNHIDLQTNNNGGCQAHAVALQIAWEEMLSMIHAGSAATVEISEKQTEPTPSDGEEPYEDWLRTTQPFKALFGNAGSLQELKARAAAVRKVYDWLIIRNRIQEAQAPRFFVLCGDDWIDYKPGTFKDPRDIGTPNQDRFTIAEPDPSKPDREKFPHGAYYLPSMPEEGLLWWDEESSRPNENEQHPFCKPGVRVTSITGYLIFCNGAFPAQGLSIEAVERQLHRGDYIDDDRQVIMLAELWFRQLFEYCWNREGIEDIRELSWEKSTAIAKRDPKRAVDLPQAYIYFATAMYWNIFYWGRGLAADKPEAEPWDPHADPKSVKEKLKDKYKGFKDKLTSGGGKKGQSSTNPHGGRFSRKRASGKATPLYDDNLGVHIPCDEKCASCGLEPKEAKPSLDANDTGNIDLQAMTPNERKKVCDEHKGDCEERRACVARIKEEGPGKQAPNVCMENLKAFGTFCNQCGF